MGARVMPFRRKRNGRTDYKKRLALLKSGLPRLVVRKSNKNIQLQIIQYLPDGDKVLATVRATELVKEGYKGNTGNIPAAYLTGLLLAKKANIKDDLIVDIGLQKHQKGSRLYAAVKGAVDGGLKVRVKDDIFPPEARLNGEHLSSDKSTIETVKNKLK